MTIIRIILWILVILFVIHLVYINTVTKETFVNDQQKTLENEITKSITLANDILCPVYHQILEQMIDENLPDSQKSLSASDQDPDERRMAKAKAISSLARATIPFISPIDPNKVDSLKFSVQTTGLLFPCPAPTNPMLISPLIDKMIIQSSKIFISRLKEMKSKIESSLSCPEKYTNYEETESFDNINPDQKTQILKQKLVAILTALASREFIELEALYKDLKELKAKAESGNMSINCA